MSDCHELDGLTTLYVDGEGSPAERQFVAAHLRTCGDCRRGIGAEATARHLLRAHASVVRTVGAAPLVRPWTPRLALTPTRVALVVLVAGLMLGVLNRPRVVEAVGVIGDSACGAHHYNEWAGVTERRCTLNCVARGAEFVLVSKDTVYRIANQTFPELSSLANVRVSVTGVLEDGTLTLAQVEPADRNHSTTTP
jgi:hypothetical protein